jgi:hypothetical protein
MKSMGKERFGKFTKQRKANVGNQKRLVLSQRNKRRIRQSTRLASSKVKPTPTHLPILSQQPLITPIPSFSQSSTSHPIALDFFAWPTIRSRLLNHHATLFQTSAGADLSSCYSRFLRFDWPFSFEDAFFLDENTGTHYPSPLFEHYHGDLKYWSVDEQFFDTFPEMRGDIEGDKEWRRKAR